MQPGGGPLQLKHPQQEHLRAKATQQTERQLPLKVAVQLQRLRQLPKVLRLPKQCRQSGTLMLLAWQRQLCSCRRCLHRSWCSAQTAP